VEAGTAIHLMRAGVVFVLFLWLAAFSNFVGGLSREIRKQKAFSLGAKRYSDAIKLRPSLHTRDKFSHLFIYQTMAAPVQ
jgi:hypothetical protein